MDMKKIIKYGSLGLRYVFGIIFIAAGAAKLYGVPMLVTEFDVVGLGQWFRYFVGVWEITGGILILLPAKRQWGAILLFLASIGAFVAQTFAIHQDWIHTIVFALLTGLLLYQDRDRFGLTIIKNEESK